MTAIMLENSTAPSSIREGVSYEAESETAKVFSQEKSPERFQPRVQIWWSISNNNKLQLPINSVSKTEDHCKYLINKNWTLAAMLFLLSDGSVSSIGQQNKSMNMRTPSWEGPARLCLATNTHDEKDKFKLFPASDKVLLKYHPPLVETQSQGKEQTIIHYTSEQWCCTCASMPISPLLPKEPGM